MKTKSYKTYRLVKSEDLNHHGTLFAGRTAEWFVESGFIAASFAIDPKYLVCVNIHGMHFSKPVKLGQTVCFDSKLAYTGNSSIITYTKVSVCGNDDISVVDGFITYLHVDENTKPQKHGLTLEIDSEEDLELYNIAKGLKETTW